MNRVGIDLGSSTIKFCVLDDEKIISTKVIKHYGKVMDTLVSELTKLDDEFILGLVGVNKRLVLDKFDLAEIEDIPSIIEGVKFINPDAKSIIEIGSEQARFITDLDAPKFSMNEHCASGTGSFFEDQMTRLNLKIEDYSTLVSKATSIPSLSGRCAVFAKTDIIHRQQEGVKKEDILLGLCYAMIRNFKSTIVKNLEVKKPLVLGGGVSLNSGVVRAIKDIFKLKDEELIVSDLARFYPSIGASLLASEVVKKAKLLEALESTTKTSKLSSLTKLSLKNNFNLVDQDATNEISAEGCYLGIDVGSTSTNLVLIDKANNLIDMQYLRTAGDPEKVVRNGMKYLVNKYGEFKVLAVGITGSGRVRLGQLMKADSIVDEITCQAKAASIIIPNVDTVFEIGGQDSKYISIKDGKVVDYEMNKICAAGTGSFVEEQALRMGLSLDEFGRLALEANHPVDLGERCTVFINSAVAEAETKGASKEDITSGLCHSIVKNYLHKVVQNKKIGNNIVLQGGVCYNPGIVAAFESNFDQKLTVNPYFSISGAYGAAVIARERLVGESTFLGFDFPNIVTIDTKKNEEINKNKNFYKLASKLMSMGYKEEIDPNKKTVGIPLSLIMFKFFPLANEFFKNLGFNVILSTPSNTNTIELARANAHGETCYPVKLLYGHMRELANKKVDYIFLPKIHTIKHVHSHAVHNYACPYMQMASEIVFNDLKLKDEGITLLDPIFDLDLGKKEMAKAMLSVGESLGFSKARCLPGLMKGAASVFKNSEDVEKMGLELLNSLAPDDKVLVIITRNYGISDPILNMGIPKMLLDRGYKVITLGHLPAMSLDLSSEYPNMYWPFGDHILSGAKLIKKHPNLYAVYLTNHGCGPDTMISHLLKEEMGDKPYLQIEVDEHYSPVGVVTRVEAFLNALENTKNEVKEKDFNILDVKINKTKIINKPLKDKLLLIPDLGLYTKYLTYYYEECGIKEVKHLEFNKETLSLGKKEMITKEYYTLTSLVGASIDAVKHYGTDIQILFPFNYGADSDGVYPRVLRSILDSLGYNDVMIVSPMLEEIASSENFNLLLRGILTGDILYNLELKDRKDFDHILSEEELLDLASLVKESPKQIGVVGSMMCLTSLDEGVFTSLEEEGYKLNRMPLSETLAFLILDEGKAFDDSLIRKVAKRMNGKGSFSNNFDNLFISANKSLEGFSANNGRYRYSKAKELGERMGVLIASPRYENTEMVLNLCSLNDETKHSVYELNFDGDFDEKSLSSLKSFLYYLR